MYKFRTRVIGWTQAIRHMGEDVDRGWCMETGPRLPNGDCPKTQIHTIISDDWARAHVYMSSDESPLLAKGPTPQRERHHHHRPLTFVTVYKSQGHSLKVYRYVSWITLDVVNQYRSNRS